MILADKIILLRKKNGWSQEELAEKLNVSRQAVSKWEGAQSVPDLGKVLQMSRIFGVTTDYLLKDELGEPEYTSEDEQKAKPIHKVSLADAQEFLAVKGKIARPTAWATFLCILSPVCLITLAGASEVGRIGISEDTACTIGLCIMFYSSRRRQQSSYPAAQRQSASNISKKRALKRSTELSVWSNRSGSSSNKSIRAIASSEPFSVFSRLCRFLSGYPFQTTISRHL